MGLSKSKPKQTAAPTVRTPRPSAPTNLPLEPSTSTEQIVDHELESLKAQVLKLGLDIGGKSKEELRGILSAVFDSDTRRTPNPSRPTRKEIRTQLALSARDAHAATSTAESQVFDVPPSQSLSKPEEHILRAWLQAARAARPPPLPQLPKSLGYKERVVPAYLSNASPALTGRPVSASKDLPPVPRALPNRREAEPENFLTSMAFERDKESSSQGVKLKLTKLLPHQKVASTTKTLTPGFGLATPGFGSSSPGNAAVMHVESFSPANNDDELFRVVRDHFVDRVPNEEPEPVTCRSDTSSVIANEESNQSFMVEGVRFNVGELVELTDGRDGVVRGKSKDETQVRIRVGEKLLKAPVNKIIKLNSRMDQLFSSQN